MKIWLDLFILGLFMGWGPCLLSCAPIVAPYIGATSSGLSKGFKAVLIFSLSRVVPYIVLALIAAGLGQSLVQRYYEENSAALHLLGGAFISILGVALLLRRWPKSLCKVIHRLPGSHTGLIVLGLLFGSSPCPPLLGLLTYIAFASKDIAQGISYGLAFALGTLFSPLILVGALAGGLSSILQKRPLVYEIFHWLSGLILVYLGAGVIIKGI